MQQAIESPRWVDREASMSTFLFSWAVSQPLPFCCVPASYFHAILSFLIMAAFQQIVLSSVENCPALGLHLMPLTSKPQISL